MKLLHSALRFRVNYFSDLGRHQVVIWMPGDTPLYVAATLAYYSGWFAYLTLSRRVRMTFV